MSNKEKWVYMYKVNSPTRLLKIYYCNDTTKTIGSTTQIYCLKSSSFKSWYNSSVLIFFAQNCSGKESVHSLLEITWFYECTFGNSQEESNEFVDSKKGYPSCEMEPKCTRRFFIGTVRFWNCRKKSLCTVAALQTYFAVFLGICKGPNHINRWG